MPFPDEAGHLPVPANLLLSEKDWNKVCWISLEKDKKDEIITTGVHGLGEVDRKFRNISIV